MPSQNTFSIFQFILSWNKERLPPEIVQTSFGDVRELVDCFLYSLAIKSFRDIPVFTKYVLSFQCQVCGHSNDQLEHWAEQLTKTVPVLPIDSNLSEVINLPQLVSSLLSRPVEIKCPSVMCNNTIRNGVLKAVPGMFSVFAVSRLSYDRDFGLRKSQQKLDLVPLPHSW